LIATSELSQYEQALIAYLIIGTGLVRPVALARNLCGNSVP